MNTQRYQYGSLTRRKRTRTEDVRQFRYYETNSEGQRRWRSRIIGMLSIRRRWMRSAFSYDFDCGSVF